MADGLRLMWVHSVWSYRRRLLIARGRQILLLAVQWAWRLLILIPSLKVHAILSELLRHVVRIVLVGVAVCWIHVLGSIHAGVIVLWWRIVLLLLLLLLLEVRVVLPSSPTTAMMSWWLC